MNEGGDEETTRVAVRTASSGADGKLHLEGSCSARRVAVTGRVASAGEVGLHRSIGSLGIPRYAHTCKSNTRAVPCSSRAVHWNARITWCSRYSPRYPSRYSHLPCVDISDVCVPALPFFFLSRVHFCLLETPLLNLKSPSRCTPLPLDNCF